MHVCICLRQLCTRCLFAEMQRCSILKTRLHSTEVGPWLETESRQTTPQLAYICRMTSKNSSSAGCELWLERCGAEQHDCWAQLWQERERDDSTLLCFQSCFVGEQL